MKIAIYCVNYLSYDSLRNYIESIKISALAAGETIEVFVFVADNSCPPKQFLYSPQNFSLQVVPTGDNLGYFGAITFLMRKFPPIDFDYSIISNVDVLLKENCLQKLVQMNVDALTGWIAPAIFSQSMQFDWNPQALQRYSLQKLKSLRFLFKYPRLLRLKQRLLHTYRHIKDCPPGPIYAGHGSFIILTKAFFYHCEIIDYPIFLYGEEIYLAELCRLHNLKVVYSPEIEVIDIGKVSTGNIPTKQYCLYNYKAIDYIIRNFYGSSERKVHINS